MSSTYWKNKRIVITGASSGLGHALVEYLAPMGVTFGLFSRRIEEMQNLARRFQNSGSRFFVRACDVRDRNTVDKCIKEFAREHGGLDVVWVNAGINGRTTFAEWSWPLVDDMIATNYIGAINTTQSALEVMVPQGHGVVAGITSGAAMGGLGGRSIYSSTKVALAYYLESMAAELPEIQFTTIYPGFVDTPINKTNPNRMWLMTPERAAPIMCRAVETAKLDYIFPWKMRLLFHMVRALPRWLYRRIARRAINITKPQ